MNDSRDPLAQLIEADATLPGPDGPALDRVWSGIEHGLASGAPGPTLDAQPLLASAGGWGWGVLSIVVLAAAGAGLVVAGARPDPIVARAGLMAPIEQAPVTQQDPQPGAVDPPVEPGPSVAEPPPAPPAAPRPRSKPDTTVAKPSLADEIALMRSLGQALARGDHKQASTLLRRHEREFPKGALLEERRAAAVRIACARDDKTAATQRSAFEARWPKSMHAAAIRKACEG